MKRYKSKEQIEEINNRIEERKASKQFRKDLKKEALKDMSSLIEPTCDGNCNDCTRYECLIKDIKL
jgi:hypothetical protein